MAETGAPIHNTKPQLPLLDTLVCRYSTGETCRIVDRWPKAERENVVRGLVPRWGRGGAWQKPARQFTVPSHNSGSSNLGVPALHRRNVPNCRPMAEGGKRKCSAGACPPLGSGWGMAETGAPIPSTKPQLPLMTPWCAGSPPAKRAELKTDGRCRKEKCSAGARPPLGSGWGVAESTAVTRRTKPQLRLFKPWRAGTRRHERLLRT